MKYGWDDELMEDDVRVWREWRREAAELDVVKIPRALLSQDKPVREASLQVFSDASQNAYGARAYLRRDFKDNTKLRRVVAYVMPFANNTRVKEGSCMTGQLKVLELSSAQNYLVKKAQAESCSEEMRRLERGQEIHKQSTPKSLDPRLTRDWRTDI